MVYERVHKSSGQSSSKKKHTPIVPPLIEQQTQADSQLSPKAMPSITPSIEEKDAINPQLFGDLTKINDTLARTQTSQQSTSNFSPQRKISALPSKEKRDAVYRQLFGNCTETDEIQSKTPESSSVAGTPIQAKLTIGAPGDKYEQEADKVAAQVVNQINAPVAQQESQNLQREDMSSEDELMMKRDTSNIQREAMPEEEEELQMKPQLQLQAGVGSMAATTELESSIQQARSGGQPLADNVRKSMEQAFGADFSGVKVHTDTQADQLNQSIQARAFTTRQDVFFRSGEYNPVSRGGQELLAHELTHVVQQSGGAVQRSLFHYPQRSLVSAHGISRNTAQYKVQRKITAQNKDLMHYFLGDPEEGKKNLMYMGPDNAGKEIEKCLKYITTRNKPTVKEIADYYKVEVIVPEEVSTTGEQEEQMNTKPDGHEGKHLKLKDNNIKELKKMTKEGSPATFVGEWANNYNKKLASVIKAAWTPDKVFQFIDCKKTVGVDAGEETQYVELYYGGGIGSHMRPKSKILIKGESATLADE